jgi:phospholipid/cholesterol/gamma-HCH transport system substrate-binding protein
MRSEDFTARVTLRLRQDVRLADGTRAELKLSTALGDQYVDLQPPAKAGAGFLAPGGTIPVADTTRGPDIETTLATLGTVLDNSGFEHARTIVTELNTMLSGREGKVRDLLSRADGILGTLEDRSADFTRALGSIDRLSKLAADNKTVLDQAFGQITPAIEMLRGEQGSLDALLAGLTPLAKSANDTLGRAEDTVAGMTRDLGPVLDALNGFSGHLGDTLGKLKTVTGLLENAVPGDYLGMRLTLDVPGSLVSLFSPATVSALGSGVTGDLSGLFLGGTR